MMREIDIEWYEKTINPYYVGLMNLNFVNNEQYGESKIMISSLKELGYSMKNDEILKLLNGYWRESKVGAWVIGLCDLKELEYDLIKVLNEKPIYCEHLIFNIAFLNSINGSNAIIKHANQVICKAINYTELGNKFWYKGIDILQMHSLGWAFEGIQYLDEMNGTNMCEMILNSDEWNHLKKIWKLISEQFDREQKKYDLIMSYEERKYDKMLCADKMLRS
jgi:hypothetical protein